MNMSCINLSRLSYLSGTSLISSVKMDSVSLNPVVSVILLLEKRRQEKKTGNELSFLSFFILCFDRTKLLI